jgi:hypothetical protein
MRILFTLLIISLSIFKTNATAPLEAVTISTQYTISTAEFISVIRDIEMNRHDSFRVLKLKVSDVLSEENRINLRAAFLTLEKNYFFAATFTAFDAYRFLLSQADQPVYDGVGSLIPSDLNPLRSEYHIEGKNFHVNLID